MQYSIKLTGTVKGLYNLGLLTGEIKPSLQNNLEHKLKSDRRFFN
jgi:hypothetical protein